MKQIIIKCGICGNGKNDEAAESICASSMGGYGDEDYGNILIYTGQGGSETKDQTMNSVNKSLTLNLTKKIPVRVVRGFQLQTKYAPKSGYRYDGLYWVTNYWKENQVLPNGKQGAKQSKSDNPISNSERGKRRGRKRKAKEIKVDLEETVESEDHSGIIQDRDEIEEHCILSRQMKGKGNSFLKTPLKNNDQYYFREREQAITKYSQKYGHVTTQYDRAHLFNPLQDIRFINNRIIHNTHCNTHDQVITNPSHLSSPQKSLMHWHGSSSEFTELPLFFRNEPDGIFIETPEQQLRYVYRYGRSIGNDLNIIDNIERVVNTMITRPADIEEEGNLSNQLIPVEPLDNNENTENNTFISEDIAEKEEIIFQPFTIQKICDICDNGFMISTSYILSEINTKYFLEILCAHSFGKRQFRPELKYQDLLLLIEKFLMKEREILQNEISSQQENLDIQDQTSLKTILQDRKLEHFNRINAILKKL
nr:unnamed protein product [Naegleria fowleri]